MEKCHGLMGKIFGHSFLDVYDLDKKIIRATGGYDDEVYKKEENVKKIFRKIVCTRCGSVIEEKKEN